MKRAGPLAFMLGIYWIKPSLLMIPKAQARANLLTPVTKAFMTDRGLDACVTAQQVFGGHGYIREWGMEQLVRDVRIAQIYEGTNGIQAADFMLRKVASDQGRCTVRPDR